MNRPLALLIALCTAFAATGCEPASGAVPDVRAQAALRANRLFDGAPPVIPHLVGDLGRDDCLNCHLKGDATDTDGDGKLAARTPHAELTNCRQCHVERITDDTFADNPFEGGVWDMGTRQTDLSPWRIPHPLTLRENCSVCHTGDNVAAHVKTTHPERTNCVQCHVPAHADWPGPRPGVTPASGR